MCSICLLPSVRAAVSKFVGVFHALAVHCGIDSQDRPNIIDVCELKLRNGQLVCFSHAYRSLRFRLARHVKKHICLWFGIAKRDMEFTTRLRHVVAQVNDTSQIGLLTDPRR